MRLQLKFYLGLIFCFICAQISSAQEVTQVNDPALTETNKSREDSLNPKKPTKLSETEVNFLFTYYDQDGDHSPVTGGIGTEALTDYSSTVIIYVPLDSSSRLGVNAGVNYYTSASTDRIDIDMSSASSADIRGQLYVTYNQEKPNKRSRWYVSGGLSSESDYLSTSLGAGWSHESADRNREFGIAAQIFLDRWQLIFPDELRGDSIATAVDTDRRNSYNLSLTYSQVLSRRLQFSISADWVYQSGLLTTPFHRVYFQEQESARIEKLPGTRFKFPLGLRVHYFLSDFLILKFNYRIYWDSWGIFANTFNIETPIKLGNYFTIYPFYRYHKQSATEYFASFKQHRLSNHFYTSDFDLSSFESHKYGLGLRYSPLYGLGRFKFPNQKHVTMFKTLELRYAHYTRIDGLDAFLMSLAMTFLIR